MRADCIDPNQYDILLEQKVTELRSKFKDFTRIQPAVFASSPTYFRQRAEFRVWHDGEELYHIMFDQDSKEKYRVDHYLVADETINNMMSTLIPLLKENDTLRRKLFQIDYLSTLSGEILVSLLYHKNLDEQWQTEAEALLQALNKQFSCHLIGRARKQKVTLNQDFVVEKLPILDKEFHFKHIENSFTQPNARVNCKMIEWALEVTANSAGDLLELYCGLGNFTLPLAQNFRQVLATEISKSSVNAAQFNIQQNQIDNVTIIRMSSEEFTQALRKEKQFTRLKDLALDSYDCQTILVDPPRSGLDDGTLALCADFKNIIYISCNPDTLVDNLKALSETHNIDNFAVFDQFPYTHHAECGVYLTKRG